MKRLWTIILSVIMGLVWGVGVGSFIAFDVWSGQSPSAPRPATGQVWEQINHGQSFYLTAYQAVALKLLFLGLFPGMLLFFAAFLLLPRRGGIRGILQVGGWWPDDFRLVIAGEVVGVALAAALCMLAGPSLVEWVMAAGWLAPG